MNTITFRSIFQPVRCFRLGLSLGLFILCFSVNVGTAHAARTLYISTGGNDTSNSCLNSSSPCKTIKYAITQMVDGDTLKVGAGSYTDTHTYTCPILGSRNYDVVIPKKNCATGCIIEAQGALGSAILKGGNGGLCVDDSDGWTVRGITFDNPNVIGSIYKSNKAVIEDTDFLYFDKWEGKVFWIDQSTDVRVSRSVFENKVACNVYSESEGLFKIQSSSNVVFEDSRFGYDNTIGSASVGSSNVTFRRNTFTHFTEHGITLDQGVSNILIENNVFRGDPACASVWNTCAGGSNAGNSCSADTACPDSYCVLETGPRVVDLYEVDGLTVRNNTVVGHGYMWQHWFYAVYSQQDQATAGCTGGICDRKNIRVYNNLVYDLLPESEHWINVSYSSFTTQSGLAFDGNLYRKGAEDWSCWPGGATYTTFDPGYKGSNCWDGTKNMDPNGVNVDPSFSNYSGGNYRAASSTSPQVNKGANGTDGWGVARCAANDFDGNSRTDGACDIGAFEFGSSGGGGGGGSPDTTPPAPPSGVTAE